MAFGRFMGKALVTTFGAFAQVALLAAAAGVELSKWPHVGATTILALPLLMLHEDSEQAVTSIPPERRDARRRQRWIAASAVFYLAVAAATLVLVAFGVRPREVGYLVGAIVVGAVPVALQLRRAAKRLARPRLAPDPPFTGGYRTRPPGPLLPDRTIEPPIVRGPQQWPAGAGRLMMMMLLSAAFVAGGVLMIWARRRPADAFHGVLAVTLFGLCTWVFGEQLLAGSSMPLVKGARTRVLVILVGASAFVCHAAWTATGVPHFERLLAGLGAGVLAVLGLVGLWKNRPRARG